MIRLAAAGAAPSITAIVSLLWIAAFLVAVSLLILVIVLRHGQMLNELHTEINSRMSKLLEVTAELAHFEGRDQERADERLRKMEDSLGG